MRFVYILSLLGLFIVSLSSAQHRVLIDPAGRETLLRPGQSAGAIVAEALAAKTVQSACPPSRQYGNIPYQGPPGTSVLTRFYHKDINAVWFTAPAEGVIESVYIYVNFNSAIGDTSSTGGKLYLRIHRSNLREEHAPGWDPYIAPPMVCWGYYENTFDHDNGVAAFSEDASDTSWHSTYKNNNEPGLISVFPRPLVDTTVQTFPPGAEEAWGMGGVEMPIRRGAVCSLGMDALPPAPAVNAGESFLISFTIPGDHPDVCAECADPTEVDFLQYDYSFLNGNPDPAAQRTATNFKFYEHLSNCSTPGWVATGGSFVRVWYSLRVNDNIPPTFVSIADIGNTFQQTGTRAVSADIEDCNFLNPSRAVVAEAQLHYRTDSDPADHVVTMTNAGGATWTGYLPAFRYPEVVRYHLTATDIDGLTSTSSEMVSRTISDRTNWYAMNLNSPRSFEGNIRFAENLIGADKFISAHDFHAGADPPTSGDTWAGTAGPFPISNGFTFFGETLHYAWIGVCGAIALSKSPTDTIPVNSAGDFSLFDLPSRIRKAYPDTTNDAGVPRNFIAPFWARWVIDDWYGRIYSKDTPDQFIVEWDSMEYLAPDYRFYTDKVRFRAILNKPDGTLEFQYDWGSAFGAESTAMVGIQGDSTREGRDLGYLLVNRRAAPVESTPRTGWQVRLWPVCAMAIADGWNMLSVPGRSWDYRKAVLFPNASSQAFAFNGGYTTTDTLEPGAGYWMKYSGAQTEGVVAGFQTCVDIAVHAKWNLIGSLTCPVNTSSIVATGTMVVSQFFGYNSGYSSTTILRPGRAYWVKVLGDDTLHICCDSPSNAPKEQADNLADANKITVSQGANRQDLYLAQSSQVKQLDFYELPPAGPEGSFDARFSSGRMVETYTGGAEQYVINLQSAKYPVTVSWQMKNAPEGKTFVMTDGGNGSEGGKVIGKVILQGQGSVRIENSALKTLVLKAESGINMPTTFALSKNYPNPFNPTTRMQLDVPVSGQVTVAIYDVLGRKVATLVDGVTEAGYHTLEWNGTNGAGVQVPSGAYFVRMQAGEFSATQKVILMR